MSARRPRRERTGEWSAEVPDVFESEEDFTLESHDLRFMWDHGSSEAALESRHERGVEGRAELRFSALRVAPDISVVNRPG